MPPNEVPGCHDGHRGAVDGALPGASKSRPALNAFKRFGPLVVIAAVMLLVFAMGWHREVTVDNIVALRDRFQVVLAEHRVASVLAFVALYIGAASLSLPGCPILTATGGMLFGWLVGGAATVVGATIGATILFLIARSAVGGMLNERAAPWLGKLRQGFKENALSYLLFLRLVPAFPFWFVNMAPAVLGVPLKTYVIATFFGIIPPHSLLRRRGPASTASSWLRRRNTLNAWPSAVQQLASSPFMQARSLPGSSCWRCCF